MIFHYILTVLISAIVSTFVYFLFRNHLRAVYMEKWGDDFLDLSQKVRKLQSDHLVDTEGLKAAQQDLRETVMVRYNRFAQVEHRERKKSKEQEEEDEVDRQIANLFTQSNNSAPLGEDEPKPKLVRRS
jgi:hypothetical protein